MRIVRLGETVPIFLQLSDEATNQYPRANFVDKNGNIVSTKDLTAISGVAGKYKVDHVFQAVGDYSIKYAVYSDAGHTTLNNKYQLGDENVRVTNLEDNVEEILNLNRDYKPPVADFD